VEQGGTEPVTGAGERLLLSIVIPVFDEQDVIEAAHRRFVGVLGTGQPFDLEIVYVDDGSRDRTPDILAAIAADDPRVSVVSFTRNFGQQPAITAGLRECAGDVVAVLDADLQDPPEIVLPMLEKWREGYSVVYGIRRHRPEPAPQRLLYSAFYRVFSALADFPIPRDSGDFCVIDRLVVDSLNALPERQRFVRALRAWYGGRQFGFAYDRQGRAAGRTKYSLRRYIDMALDSILSFSAAPLRKLALAGLALSFLSVAGFAVLLLCWISGATSGSAGMTPLVLALLLLSGVQLLSVGIIGSYLGRIYGEAKGRPAYLAQAIHPSLYRRREAGATKR
jgi:glycosyltransferase involved in cell wall biosynthesis